MNLVANYDWSLVWEHRSELLHGLLTALEVSAVALAPEPVPVREAVTGFDEAVDGRSEEVVDATVDFNGGRHFGLTLDLAQSIKNNPQALVECAGIALHNYRLNSLASRSVRSI